MPPGVIRTLALLTGLGLIGLAATLAGNTPALVWVIGLGLLWSVFQLLSWRTPSLPPPAPVASPSPGTASPSPGTPDVLAAIARLTPLIDIRTVFRSTAAVLAESLNADFCLLYDVDNDEGQLRQSEPRGPRINLADRPDLLALLEQDRPLAIEVADAQIHPAERALLQDHGVAQALNVPMRLNGQARCASTARPSAWRACSSRGNAHSTTAPSPPPAGSQTRPPQRAGRARHRRGPRASGRGAQRHA